MSSATGVFEAAILVTSMYMTKWWLKTRKTENMGIKEMFT